MRRLPLLSGIALVLRAILQSAADGSGRRTTWILLSVAAACAILAILACLLLPGTPAPPEPDLAAPPEFVIPLLDEAYFK